MALLISTEHLNRAQLIRLAYGLAIFTVAYNLAEGFVSMYFGIADETLALAGFGADSFIECVSAAGILHLVRRMRRNDARDMVAFEQNALRITGAAFYALTLALLVGAGLSFWHGASPATTTAGIVVSLASLAIMQFLYSAKRAAGKALGSQAILSDAQCTRACFWLSFVLLGSSLAYMAFGFVWVDAVGSLGVAVFSIKEGREAFAKAKKATHSCGDNCC